MAKNIKVDRGLCPECSTVRWLVDLKGKGRSVGQEWATCKKCGKQFHRPTKDEPLILVRI